jgi:uncharacterized protein with von Willebrand factor type A (vWA) domain
MSVASHGLTAQLARFAAALRRHGVRVGLGDEMDAGVALTLVDLMDRDEVHRALLIAFKVPREAWTLFDELFQEYWGGTPPPRSPVVQRPLMRDHRGPPQWKWDGERVQLRLPEAQHEVPDGEHPGYSAEPLLRQKSFDTLSAGELAALERLVTRLALRLATRRSRRLVPTRGRGRVDLRRSFRDALGTEGELLNLARRTHAVEEPRLVLLYDTSGSMDSYARVLLAFAFALRRVIPGVEIFAFNTCLTRVTRLVAPDRVARTLERLAASVPDWSGGTRIGSCLAQFVERHLRAMVDRHTTVVIASDGLDLGDTALLKCSMQALRSRAGRVVWLNPLMGDARYRPTAAGMSAALPYVDHLAPAHNLESLENLLRILK